MELLQTTLCYLEKDGAYLMLHRVKKKNDVNHPAQALHGPGIRRGAGAAGQPVPAVRRADPGTR